MKIEFWQGFVSAVAAILVIWCAFSTGESIEAKRIARDCSLSEKVLINWKLYECKRL